MSLWKTPRARLATTVVRAAEIVTGEISLLDETLRKKDVEQWHCSPKGSEIPPEGLPYHLKPAPSWALGMFALRDLVTP